MDHTDDHLSLARAADAFDAIIHERGWGQPPLLLRIEGGLDPDKVAELAVRALDGHPAEALLGFSAPPTWTAMGVGAEGWATSCAAAPHGDQTEAPAGAGRERVRSVVLLGRRGGPVGRLRWADGRTLAQAPDEGRVLDCLARALGRATAPPSVSTDVLFATMWLENLAAHGRGRRQPLSWDQAAALHPAGQLLAKEGPPVHPDDLVPAAAALGRVCDWSMVRQQAMHGWNCGLDPALARWMDPGMVSRWLLDSRAGLDELLGHVGEACSLSALRRIRQSLAALGVESTSCVA
ncbi:MAG TPA: hypothetical protein VK988_22760 [Acidimicrobiales bacterium]|nr:hypothetical protein [Acidimicrobiales bacterium]